MRFPKPPLSIVSWLGKSRSYESILSSWRSAIVSVMRWQPIFRATAAPTGSEKKNHTCAPLPDRERSMSGVSANRRAVVTKALTSSRHVLLSKSAARSQHVSSGSMGYTPMTCLPRRWPSTAASSTRRKACFVQSPHFTFGSWHTPATNLFALSGA